MTDRTHAARANPETGAVIVLGLDTTGKPRAARFPGSQAVMAKKAAELMGLKTCPVTPELTDVAKKLPAGRIYSNGHGFVPNIRKSLFAKLIAASGVSVPSWDEGSKPGAKAAAAALPASWDDIEVGSLVLIHSPTWWEGVVIARADDMLTLRWRDSPDDPPVVRHRTAVALLNAAPANPRSGGGGA